MLNGHDVMQFFRHWLYVLIMGLLAVANCRMANCSEISAVWANDGGDKVTRDEIRASAQPMTVLNSIWNGTAVSLFGAKNEVISFNLVLEAAYTSAKNVSVELSNLTGPSGSVIRYVARDPSNLFDWTNTDIELFYVRYLKIEGLSQFGYGALKPWQEPVFPKRARCSNGVGCSWNARFVANKFYPDIAVPLELEPAFAINAGSNQAIWVDIYIPKTVAHGTYAGTVMVRESGRVIHTLPIGLNVRNFTLPDMPNSKTMLHTSYHDLLPRYGTSTLQAMKNQLFVAHRHKISLIDDNMGAGWDSNEPSSPWVPFLLGTAFTSENGYAGPGVGVGNNVYSIGTYGTMTRGTTRSALNVSADGWETWFEAYSPSTERFVYVCDEVDCLNVAPNLATLVEWMSSNTGLGRNLHSMATQPLSDSPKSLNNPTSFWAYSKKSTAVDQAAVNALRAEEPTRRLFAYGSTRPGEGSVATEDEGVSLRELPWGQFKMKVDRWFIWESTYYNDYQNNRGDIDVFATAQTYGAKPTFNPRYGMIDANSSNGEGVLFYPGTDNLFPTHSYGVNGPITSLRLKYWRRGIQDVDYLVLADAVNPTAVANLVHHMVPKALWEIECDKSSDCTYSTSPISWSINPDDWEAARSKLANIIDP